MTFKVIDYNYGNTGQTISINTLLQLKKYAQENGYNAVWPDFDHEILWVTKYNKFTQR